MQQQERKVPEGWDPQTRGQTGPLACSVLTLEVLEIRNGSKTAAALEYGEDSPIQHFLKKLTLRNCRHFEIRMKTEDRRLP